MKISTIFQRLGILICLISTHGFSALAQSPSYKPMLQDGKEWYLRSVYLPRGADKGFYRKICGDTLICGVSYKKLVNWKNQFMDGLREEGRKVYSAEGGELFDFNLQEGDTLYSDYGTVAVSTGDSIRVDGRSYLRLGIAPADLYTEDDGFQSPWEYWVEGIGSSFGIYPIWGMYIIGPHNELDSCKVDGKLIFTRNDFLRAPNSERQWVHCSYAYITNGNQTYWYGSARRTYATIGDTEENGKTYQKVYDCTESRCAGNDADKRYKYLFAMRNEDGRVLADAESYAAAYPKAVTEYPQNDAGEFILYDYNAHVGDAYLGRADITVEQKGDTTLADGQAHRLLVLSTGHRLVEGIGCVNAGGAPFAYLCHPAYTSPVDNVTLLETYYDAEGHRVYVNSRERLCDEILAGVKPVVSQSTNRTDASAVYDLQGRRMDGRSLPKGIYIQGGRKFVVK